MKIESFDNNFGKLKDKDVISLDCDCPNHVGVRKCTMPKVSARRNILKNAGKEFICRACFMKFKNPAKVKPEQKRQTDEEIIVVCPDPRHSGDKHRTLKTSAFFGDLAAPPYIKVCKSCAQLEKQITEEQREKISKSLTGIKRSDDFKKKLSNHMKTNANAIARATKNLMENRGINGMLGKHHTEEHKNRMSATMSGRVYDDEHRKNISEGRKKMLDAQGGLLKSTREKLSTAAAKQHADGFDPKTHHASGTHISSKCDKVIKFKSSYEKKALLKLDADENVLKYEYESVVINYYNPEKDINSSYLVDLKVYYKDGTVKLIEIKPNKFLTDPIVMAKIKAATTYAELHSLLFEIWEEVILFGAVYNEKNMRAFCEKVKNGEI
jgi:hypothetical protein